MDSREPEAGDQGAQREESASENIPEEPMLFCPTCGNRLDAVRCKLICPQCGYFMSCADYY